MRKQSHESEKKRKIRNQIQKIRTVFGMSPEAVKKHPQLKKIQAYLEEEEGKEKYAIGNGDTYIVYKPEYDVYAKGNYVVEGGTS